jgi:hypothetical protein
MTVKEHDIMREQLEQRLKELHSEYEAGQKMQAELDARQAELRNKMLRISGAIQVIEEELERAAQSLKAVEVSQ